MFYRPVFTCAAVAALILSSGLASAQLIDQTSYQGRLELNGASATGPWGVTFRVWDSAIAGAPVSGGLTRALTLVPADNGVFIVNDLNFGMGVFDGTDRWLELVVWEESVLVNGLVDPGELVETLTRQPITGMPQAQYALESGVAGFAAMSGTTLNEAHTNGNVIANNGGAAIVVEGGLEIGTSALNGRFDFNSNTAGLRSNIRMRPFFMQGASLQHFDENGLLISDIEPDTNGEGIYARFSGDGGSMTWDGDLSTAGVGSGSRLTISGPGSTAIFNTKLTGDPSVILPTDAVSPSETMAEAGVANIQGGLSTLGIVKTVLLSRSITVPTSGYVLALAQGQLHMDHFVSAGAASSVTYGVSNTKVVMPSNQRVRTTLPASLPAGFYSFSASAHGLFEVASAGTHTFYFIAAVVGSNGNYSMSNQQLTLLFVPTAYGAVQSNLIDPANPGGGNNNSVALAPMTDQDIEAEYRAELARVRLEMQAKDSEQQRQLDELRLQMKAVLREQELGRNVTLER